MPEALQNPAAAGAAKHHVDVPKAGMPRYAGGYARRGDSPVMRRLYWAIKEAAPQFDGLDKTALDQAVARSMHGNPPICDCMRP